MSIKENLTKGVRGMKVCFLTLGSRGDVQPYVALAKGLIKRGHTATLCTGASFKDFVEENGIPFKAATMDLMAIAQTAEGRAILEAPFKQMRQALRLSKEVLKPAYRKTLDDFFEAAKDADIIIYHPKALGAVDIGVYYGIPCISMPPVPTTYPITEFPNLALIPRGQLGRVLNRLSYKVNEKAESAYLKEINAFRLQVLGLPPRKVGEYYLKRENKEIPTIYPISPLLFPEVHSWIGHVYLPGFLYLEEEEDSLPEEIEVFLQQGEKPIAVTFSSMPLKEPLIFMQHLEKALKTTRQRAIVLIGNSGIKYRSNEQIQVIGEVSHTLLFKRVKGVIHHGGVGTMSAALRAGIPQQIIPFSVDQPFWAQRLYTLGYSLKPLQPKQLTIEILTNILEQMKDDKIKAVAREVATKINKEEGIEALIAYLLTL